MNARNLKCGKIATVKMVCSVTGVMHNAAASRIDKFNSGLITEEQLLSKKNCSLRLMPNRTHPSSKMNWVKLKK